VGSFRSARENDEKPSYGGQQRNDDDDGWFENPRNQRKPPSCARYASKDPGKLG